MSNSNQRGFADLFVARPILALVLNLLITIAGLAALMAVDVREMPNVDQPVISVRASFDGAAPETVDTEVTSVLEDALTALEGVKSISSTSSYGSSRITIELSDHVDIDTAANEAREIVTRTRRDLPEDMDDPTVSKNDADASPIARLALLGKASTDVLTDLAEGPITDRLSSIEGIAEIEIAGDQSNEFLLRVDMTALAGRGLTFSDLASALATLRNSAALGDLDSAAQTVVLRSSDADVDLDVINTLLVDGTTRVGDVAFVQYGPQERDSISRVNGQSAIGINVTRQSQGNTLSISQELRAAVAELQPTLPEGVRLIVTADDGVFIERSITEVATSILLAVGIVVAVIFVFLRSVRATLIPTVTIPVALIGAVAAIWLAGFSINTITLLALVLASGMVVDDAIVVVENIVRRRGEGLGPRAAAAIGTNEVFFAVISTTATLAAVFIPISFLPGQAGGIFAEFGFALAFCVTLSSLVALTLVPMMASLTDPGRTGASEGPAKEGLGARICVALVDRAIRFPMVPIGLAVAFAIVAFGTFGSLSSELTPSEDRGGFFISARAPSGASVGFTDAQVRKVEEVLQPWLTSGEIVAVQTMVGLGSSSNAFVIARLADWQDRDATQAEIVTALNARLRDIPGLTVSARSGNSLGIRGVGRGLQFAVTGTDYDHLVTEASRLVAAMAQDPTFANPQLGSDASQPLVGVHIDREAATGLGLSLSEITSTLAAMTEGKTAASVFVAGEETDIRLVPGGAPIDDPADLERVVLRADGGAFVPLSSVVTLEQTAASASLARESGRRAVSVQANLGAGVDLGMAADRLTALAREVLEDGTRIAFLAEAATLEDSRSGTAMVFGAALLIVLLVLAAQFESFASAAVIMLTVPFGLGAAVMAIALSGGTLNYYSQIGLMMLIGIMAKNGILIVEFANQLRAAGQDVDSAIRDAVHLRLRPVMMTMVSTVCGGLPLILSTGAGAEARVAVGWVVVGGLGFATVFTLFLTPIFYRLVAPLGGVPGGAERRLHREQQTGIAPAE